VLGGICNYIQSRQGRLKITQDV